MSYPTSPTCGICSGPMKPLFNVGFFCPRDCDVLATGDQETLDIIPCAKCKSLDTAVFADPWGHYKALHDAVMMHCWTCGSVWKEEKENK